MKKFLIQIAIGLLYYLVFIILDNYSNVNEVLFGIALVLAELTMRNR